MKIPIELEAVSAGSCTVWAVSHYRVAVDEVHSSMWGLFFAGPVERGHGIGARTLRREATVAGRRYCYVGDYLVPANTADPPISSQEWVRTRDEEGTAVIPLVLGRGEQAAGRSRTVRVLVGTDGSGGVTAGKVLGDQDQVDAATLRRVLDAIREHLRGGPARRGFTPPRLVEFRVEIAAPPP